VRQGQQSPAIAIGLIGVSCILTGCATIAPDSERGGYSTMSREGLTDLSRANSSDDNSNAWEAPWLFLQTLLYGFCSGNPSFSAGK
jgi:hypothetical protein